MYSLALQRYTRLIERLASIALFFGTIALFGILLLILSEVFARNALNHSIHFSWDFSGYLMGAMFMLAAARALRAGVHVRVTALCELMPRKVRWLMDLAACLIGLLMVALMLWAIGSMAWLSYVRGTTSATVSLTPLWIPQTTMMVGVAILFLQMLATTLQVLSGNELTFSDSDPAGEAEKAE